MRWCLILLGACGRLNFEPSGLVASDGPPGDGPQDAPACVTLGMWQPPTKVSASTSGSDFSPALHPNGLVLVFDTNEPGPRQLAISIRDSRNDPFVLAELIPGLNNADDNMQAAWSPDGKSLHWHRLGGVNERMIATYDEPTMGFGIPDIDDLPSNGDNFTFTDDFFEVYYTVYTPESDLAHARRDGFGAAWVMDNEVANLVTAGPEGYPSINGDTIYFESREPMAEIEFATRTTPGGPFGTAAVVQELVIPTGSNGDPEVSRDGTTMVFVSDRDVSGTNDLFITTRSCQ